MKGKSPAIAGLFFFNQEICILKDFLPSHSKIKPVKMKKLFTLCGAIGLALSASAQVTPVTDIKAAPKAPSNTELERSAHASTTEVIALQSIVGVERLPVTSSTPSATGVLYKSQSKITHPLAAVGEAKAGKLEEN